MRVFGRERWAERPASGQGRIGADVDRVVPLVPGPSSLIPHHADVPTPIFFLSSLFDLVFFLCRSLCLSAAAGSPPFPQSLSRRRFEFGVRPACFHSPSIYYSSISPFSLPLPFGSSTALFGDLLDSKKIIQQLKPLRFFHFHTTVRCFLTRVLNFGVHPKRLASCAAQRRPRAAALFG